MKRSTKNSGRGILVGLVILFSVISLLWQSGVSSAQGQALAPDLTFGTNGKVQTKFSAGGYAYGLAVRADGDIVVVGKAFVDKRDTNVSVGGIVEYESSGKPRRSFGQNGVVLNTKMTYANTVIEQPDGKLVVEGQIAGAQAQAFVIARYNADGSLDTSFGDAGEVSDSYLGPNDGVARLALQPDGKILVAGTADTTPSGATQRTGIFAVARYNSDGTVDTSFGASGKVTTGFNPGYTLITAVTVQSDGKILAGGWAGTADADSTTFGIGLARYNSDGSPDSTFGTGGKTFASISGASEEIGCLALDSAGNIVVGGVQYFAGGNEAKPDLARFNSAGVLDTSFGNGGRVDLSSIIGGLISAIRIQSDGQIFVSGFMLFPYATAPTGVFSSRYNSDGTPDGSYNGGTPSDASFYSSFGQPYVGAFEPNGEYVVAGYDRALQPTDRFGLPRKFLLLRYQTGSK
ncbi:MAG: delta-60 repeat domain-containing protein [Blastocatellia bacterium]